MARQGLITYYKWDEIKDPYRVIYTASSTILRVDVGKAMFSWHLAPRLYALRIWIGNESFDIRVRNSSCYSNYKIVDNCHNLQKSYKDFCDLNSI